MSSTEATVRHTGKVKWFSDERCYGFLEPDGVLPNHSGDVFVHLNQVKARSNLMEGQRVSFTLGSRRGKSQAEDVRVV